MPGLPLRRVVQILERFEPDESAPDPVPPGELVWALGLGVCLGPGRELHAGECCAGCSPSVVLCSRSAGGGSSSHAVTCN